MSDSRFSHGCSARITHENGAYIATVTSAARSAEGAIRSLRAKGVVARGERVFFTGGNATSGGADFKICRPSGDVIINVNPL